MTILLHLSHLSLPHLNRDFLHLHRRETPHKSPFPALLGVTLTPKPPFGGFNPQSQTLLGSLLKGLVSLPLGWGSCKVFQSSANDRKATFLPFSPPVLAGKVECGSREEQATFQANSWFGGWVR